MPEHTPLLIAHRGDCQNFPENTIEAFESAFQKGADGVELDIHEQDGDLIVVHNYNYDRSARYPLLRNVLEEFAQRGRLEIEVKTMGLSFVAPLQRELRPYADNDIELTTSVAGLFAHLRPAFPKNKIGAIFPASEFEPWMLEEKDFYIAKVAKLLELYQADVAHLPFQVCTEQLVARLHDGGKLVHTNLAGQPNERQQEMFGRVVELGIDQITFDDISLVSRRA